MGILPSNISEKNERDWKKTTQHTGEKTIQESGRSPKGLHTVAQSYPTVTLSYAKTAWQTGAISADGTWYSREGSAASLTIARQTYAESAMVFPVSDFCFWASYHWKKPTIYRGHLSQGNKELSLCCIFSHWLAQQALLPLTVQIILRIINNHNWLVY